MLPPRALPGGRLGIRSDHRFPESGTKLGILGIVLLAACASSAPPAAPQGRIFSRLLPPSSGRYAITREGEAVGEERFTITSSQGVWQVRGEIELAWPVEGKQGYELSLDTETREPIAFLVWLEIVGERQVASGRCDGEFVHIETENIMGRTESRVPYARGTMIDFSSPIFNAVVLGLLGTHLASDQSVPVRTIVLALPMLLPAVVLETYQLAGHEGSLRRVTVGQADGKARPTAMWVRDDGMPVRVRTWPEGGGAPFEMMLSATPETGR
jgi:hypothetical protein